MLKLKTNRKLKLLNFYEKGLFIAIFGLLYFFMLIITGSVIGQSPNYERFGIEIDGIVEGDVDRTFTDLAKSARPFEKVNGAYKEWAITDENGWPLEDARMVVFDVRPNEGWWCPYNYSVCVADPEAYYPDYSGIYKVSFNGQAELQNTDPGDPIISFHQWSVENQIYDAATNTTTLDLIVPENTTLVSIQFINTKKTASSATNTGFANLKIERPGYHGSYQRFTNEFLSALEKFSCIRYMDWTHTNNNNKTYPAVINWNERKNKITNASFNEGAPWELVVELANLTQKDAWINVPVDASDDYISNLAQLFKNNLDPNLNLYIELSNELWNSQFDQYKYIYAAASTFQGQAEWQAQRLLDIALEFQSAFGTSDYDNRVQIVYATQSTSGGEWGRLGYGLRYIQNNYGAPADLNFSASLAPYFGRQINTTDPNEIITQLAGLIDSEAISRHNEFMQTASIYNIPVHWYESGQHVTKQPSALITANRLDGMKPVYKDYYQKGLDNGADLMIVFALSTQYNKYGAWGLTWDITNLNTPKFNAIHDLVPEGIPVELTDYLNLNASSLTFGKEASSQTVNVSSDQNWTVSDNQPWISTSITGGSNDGSFDISVDDNTGGSRTGLVTIAGGTHTREIAIKQASSISYTVSVTSANGTVTIDPDQTSYEEGSIITLQADANSGYMFENWSGSAESSENPLTITVNGNKNITANYIVAPPGIFVDFEDQTEGEIAEIAISGFVFKSEKSNGNAENIKVLGASSGYESKVIHPYNYGSKIVIYKQDNSSFELTSLDYATGQWGGTSDATIIGTKSDNSIVETTYTADSKTLTSLVLNWTDLQKVEIDFKGGANDVYGALDNIDLGSGGTPPEPTTYALTVNSGSGDGSYEAGELVNISADAAPSGQTFDAWTGDTSALADAGSANTSATMPAANIAVTATYKDIPVTTYSLTVNNGSGDGNYAAGEVVSISADAAPSGQTFDAWTGDTSALADAGSENTSVTMPSADVSVTANYKDIVAGDSYRYLRLNVPNAIASAEVELYDVKWKDGSNNYYDATNYWKTSTPANLDMDLGAGNSITPVAILLHPCWTVDRAPAEFYCYGSNDNSNWTLIHSETNLTTGDYNGKDTDVEFVFASTPNLCTVELSSTSESFNSQANSVDVTVTTDEVFTVSADQSWISITTNNNTLTILVEENTSTSERTGTVTIDGCESKTISITQDGALPPSENIVIDFENQTEGKISVVSVSGFEFRSVKQNGNLEKIQVLGTSNGYESKVIHAANYGSIIEFKKADNTSFDLQSFDYATSQYGQASDALITGTKSDNSTITESISSSTKTAATKVLNWTDLIKVEVNYASGNSKVYGALDNIIIGGDNTTVPCTLSVSSVSESFSSYSGSSDITVTTSESFTVSADQSWISTTLNGDVLTISVTSNTGTSDRTGIVTVNGCENKTIAISQSGEQTTPTPIAKALIGTNLAEITPFSEEVPFINLAKRSLGWFSLTSQNWNEQYPISNLTQQLYLKPGQSGALNIFWDGKSYTGSYVLTYDGTASNVEISTNGRGGSVDVISSTSGRIEVNLTNVKFLFINVTTSSSLNPISNIRFTTKANENNLEMFDPEFLDNWREFKAIRFMDWMSTNNSKVATQNDYPNPGALYQHNASMDVMVALCNELNADMWICIPHLAEDALIREFALYVRDNLNENLTCYVEYSNEVWNSQFAQHADAAAAARSTGISNTGNNWEDAPVWTGYRSYQVHQIFEDEFNKVSNKPILHKVLAWQAFNSWFFTTGVMPGYKLSGGSSARPTSVAIAPYIGGALGWPNYAGTVQNWTVNQVFDQLNNGGNLTTEANASLEGVTGAITDYKTIADELGIKLTAYEGGQHLVGVGSFQDNVQLMNLFIACNRDDQMKQLYLDYLDAWKNAGGDLFCSFSSCTAPDKYGSWGVIEYQAQTQLDAPKYDALLTWMATNNKNASIDDNFAKEMNTDAQSKFSIYPNPTSNGVVYIKIGNESSHVNIYDLTGKTVYSQSCSNSVLEINVDQFKRGLYIVHINGRSEKLIVR